MSASALAKKILLKPGHRVLVKSAPDGFIDKHLTQLPVGAEISTTARGQFDAEQFLVKSQAAIRKFVPQLEKPARDECQSTDGQKCPSYERIPAAFRAR
jgi:hypothetical protein